MACTRRRVAIVDVVKKRLCCGCGACAVACPEGALTMVEGERYNYAAVDAKRCKSCERCCTVCPSVEFLSRGGTVQRQASGTCAACYLAHATDESVRRDAASGGFISALLIYLLALREIDGAVLVAADNEHPFQNCSRVARTREAVLLSMGSRYSPASACTAIQEILDVPGRYAFVGKPCEISAVRNLQQVTPLLRERVVLAIGLFCAQTPARNRTVELLRARRVDMGQVRKVTYRGLGWPGAFSAWDGEGPVCGMPYAEAWRFLAGGVPALRCLLCADGVSRDADLSVGDPWGAPQAIDIGLGRSLVLARTAVGARVTEQAASGGVVSLEPAAEGWVQERLRVQARREAAARSRTVTYRAISLQRCDIAALVAGRADSGRTILRILLGRKYY